MSKYTHGDFKYLTKDEWDNLQGTPIDTKNVFNESVAKPRFEKCANNYSLEVNRTLKSSDDKDELRIVLLGKTGAGKSATGNTVLGDEAFRNEPDAVSITAKSRCIRKTINGRNVKVMDTPGLHDTRKSNAVVLQEIARVTKIFPEGVHAFLYVRNISDTRFTKEDMQSLELIEKKFGGKMKPFRILVYTNGQCQLQDKDLDRFCLHQTQDEEQLITKFIEELNGNMVAVDNKTTVPAERERNQNVILALVDKVRRQNGGNVYTSEMFSKALEEHKKMQIDAARKGWSPELMDIVDMFIAADPDIVTRKDELGRKVYEYQMKKRENALKEQLNEQLESKMAELDAEKRRIGEIEEKQKQAEEQLRLKIEEDQKRRQMEQKELMKMLEEEKEKQKESEEKWLARVKEVEEKQRQIQEEEKRKSEEEQKRLQEETMRIERERKEFEKKMKEAEDEKEEEMLLLQKKMDQLKLNAEKTMREAKAIAEEHESFFSSVTRYLKGVWDSWWGK